MADHETSPETDARTPSVGLAKHEVRTALLALLAETGTLTSTEAAACLGYSSGLCSFHLRRLARYGRIEEAPHSGGRARPWQLRRQTPKAPVTAGDAADTGFDTPARGLEDESYQRWLGRRDQAPNEWREADEAFSAIAYLTPQEIQETAEAIRQLLSRYQDRDHNPAARPADALPVAAVARLFPLLPAETEQP
ncbi:helix-turn-helix domain-containing protein [Streptomyces prunicolor]|uniref:helix-turn-helix domain-containing protein n=1 Tax=Streptomyces prunicolor TaxID=67348 RepID=UPI00343BD90F